MCELNCTGQEINSSVTVDYHANNSMTLLYEVNLNNKSIASDCTININKHSFIDYAGSF